MLQREREREEVVVFLFAFFFVVFPTRPPFSASLAQTAIFTSVRNLPTSKWQIVAKATDEQPAKGEKLMFSRLVNNGDFCTLVFCCISSHSPLDDRQQKPWPSTPQHPLSNLLLFPGLF